MVRPAASASTTGAIEGRDGWYVGNVGNVGDVGDVAGGPGGTAAGTTIVGSWLLGSIRAVSSRPKSRYVRVPGSDPSVSGTLLAGATSTSVKRASSAAMTTEMGRSISGSLSSNGSRGSGRAGTGMLVALGGRVMTVASCPFEAAASTSATRCDPPPT